MLNYPTEDPEDKELLDASFEALHDSENVTIVSDLEGIEFLSQRIATSVVLPAECQFSIANLFRIAYGFSTFYIAQCLQDYRFLVTGKGWISGEYSYRVIGWAELVEPFSRIVLRPELKTDRLVGKFFNSDIKIEGAAEFNKRYYLAAKNREAAKLFFQPGLIKVLGSSRGVHMTVNESKVFVSFENEMEIGHSRLAESILRQIPASKLLAIGN